MNQQDNCNDGNPFVASSSVSEVTRAGIFDDLKLTAEELDEIKGGCCPFHKDDTPERPTGGGGFINNHNETVESDEDGQSLQLSDLTVATEQAEEVKGGSLSGLNKADDVTLKRGIIG